MQDESLTLTGRVWQDGVLVAESLTADALPQTLADPKSLVWVDLLQPTEQQMTTLTTLLGLPAIAAEDAVAKQVRSRLTRREKYLFFTVFDTVVDFDTPEPESLRTRRISGIALPNVLVTIREDADLEVAMFTSRWDEDAGQVDHGSALLLYGLLDAVADSHFAAIQDLDDQIEQLEDDLFEQDRTPEGFQHRLYGIRKDLVELRYVVLPMREIVNGLLLHPTGHESMSAWYDDLYFRALRAAEWTDSLRDMVTSLFETNLSLQDARLNTIMKKLSAWAAIIAVPTAITGWFGQNIPYWGFSNPNGLWLSVGLIVVSMVVLYLVFRRNDWL